MEVSTTVPGKASKSGSGVTPRERHRAFQEFHDRGSPVSDRAMRIVTGQSLESQNTAQDTASEPRKSLFDRFVPSWVRRGAVRKVALAGTLAAVAVGVGADTSKTTTAATQIVEASSPSADSSVVLKESSVPEGVQPIKIESGKEANMIPNLLRQYFRTDQNQPLWQYLNQPAQDVPYMSRTQNTPIIYERYAFDPQHSNITADAFSNLQNPGNYDELDYSVWFQQKDVNYNPRISCNVLVDRSSGKVVLTQLQFLVGENGNLMEIPYYSSDYWLYHTQASYQDMEATSALWLKTVPRSWKEVANHEPILLGMAERQIEGTVATNSSSTDIVVESTGDALITTSYTQK